MKRSVRRLAWIGTVVGALVTVLGFMAAFLPLAAIGVVLAGAGVWNLCRPSITGVIVDGGVMILTGAFNCLAWLWMEEARVSSVGLRSRPSKRALVDSPGQSAMTDDRARRGPSTNPAPAVP